MSTPKTATVELLSISALEVEPDYNVRTPAELKANAKEIAERMELLKDDITLPQFRIQYVERDGKKYTRSHGTLEAAKLRGWKKVNAEKIELPTFADDHLHLIVSNNGGHPLSRKQQGAVFARLRDGLLETLEAATERAKVGEEIVQNVIVEGMKSQDIAEKFGCSRQHVDDCLAILEAPEEIGEMIDDGRLSGNVFLSANKLVNKHHDGKKSKLAEICRASIKAAKDDGKDRATLAHFDAVKSDFIPLKAATTSTGKDGETCASSHSPQETKSNSRADSGASEGADSSNPSPAPETQPELVSTETVEIPTDSSQMTEAEEKLFSGSVPKKYAAQFAKTCKLIDRWAELFGEAFSDDERDRLASAVVLSADVPF
jgi:hypothetical protein